MKNTKMKEISVKKQIINKAILNRFIYCSLAVFIILAICFVIVWGGRPYREKLNEGDISMKNIYAPFDFSVKDGVDKETTAKLKQQAYQQVKDIYAIDKKASERIYGKLNNFFDKIIDLRKKELPNEENLAELLYKEFNLKLAFRQISMLLETERLEDLHKIGKDILQYVIEAGLIADSTIQELNNKDINSILVYKDNKLEEVGLKDILSEDIIGEFVRDKLIKHFPDDKVIRDAMFSLIIAVVEPNVRFDSDMTQQKKEEAESKVLPVYKRVFVKQNEQIVERGQRVNKKQIKLLSTIDQVQQGENGVEYILGIGAIVVLFALSLLLFIYIYHQSFFNINSLLLMGLLILFLLGVAKAIIVSPLSSYLIPLASVSMLIAILLNFHLAIFVTIFLSFITGLMVGNGLTIAIVFFIGSVFSLFMLRNIRSRVKILKATLIVSSVNFIAIVALGYFQNLDYETFFTQSLWGIGNGFLSGLLVMGLLPIFEYVFNITTDISLLELSDLNHPLLKEMILKAPGTYHHSLIVGNLSEAACEAIGANFLLARVASYFHDIGKIDKAEYFSENQIQSQSKHDKLTPDMSKLIIIKHVKKGIDLAKKFKLKQSIIDIIAQHHGTGLVFYFFKRALDEKMDEVEIDEEYYRYPGPKPQTREAAVVLLADSVEAASRALSGPTPSSIKSLVRKVINNKFIDGQLDECNLTLKELNKIAEVFIRILTGVFHSRIEYPEELNKEEL